MTILNRFKLLFIRNDIAELAINMNNMYSTVVEKQKPQFAEKFDNIDKTLQIMHTRGLKEGFKNDYQKQRTGDIALKLMLLTY